MADGGVKRTESAAASLDAARKQLDFVLGFFTRAESRLSLVFGTDLAMAGLLVASAPPAGEYPWLMAIAIAPLCLLGWSVWHLYLAFFPQLEGGEGSLIYFREIARRSEAQFLHDWSAETNEKRLQDTLRQVWRNSEILTQKFDHLKSAFQITAWALIPWLITLELFVLGSPPSKSLLGR